MGCPALFGLRDLNPVEGRQGGRMTNSNSLCSFCSLVSLWKAVLLCHSRPPNLPLAGEYQPAFALLLKYPRTFAPLITPAVVPWASLIAQYPFHNKVSQTAQKTFVPGQNQHVHLREHAPLRDTLLFSFQEGLVSAFMLPLTNQELVFCLVAAVFQSLPVSISAGREWTRKFLPKTGTWVNRWHWHSPWSLFCTFLKTCLHPV